MKKIISLAFISILFLCSCKTNSFTKQRYTKLGHSSQKQNVVVFKSSENRTSAAVVLKEEVANENEVILLADAEISKPVSAGASKTFLPNKLIKPLIETSKKTYTKPGADLKKADQENISTNKTFKQKVQRAAGLFDTLFKIVLWSIILAVAVAIIIIIILT